MRQYNYHASESSVAALRRLRGPWARVHIIDTAVTVVLADEQAVIIQVEAADVEDAFEAFRLQALVDPTPMVYGEPAPAFTTAGNDVVIFTGATWSEPNGATIDPVIRGDSVIHFSGHPGQISETADVVCLTSDAVVIASPDGVGWLIRTALKPYALEVVTDPDAVRKFLQERGYTTEG